jgi:hypothetical protein
MALGTPIWRLALAFITLGVGMAFVWAPLTATATRNLPPHLAGASSGVYNTTRQLGAVLGSAGMAAFMTSRIGAQMPGGGHASNGAGALRLPAFLREPFAAAMSQSILLPAFVALFGVIAALFLVDAIGSPSTREVRTPESRDPAGAGPDGYDAHDAYDAYDAYDDGDDYIEYILRREVDVSPQAPQGGAVPRRSDPPVSAPRPVPIGFVHNGFPADHALDRRTSRPAGQFPPAGRPAGSPGAHTPHRFAPGEPSRNKHDRAGPEDPASGRHSR